MLAAHHDTLPEPMREAVTRCFKRKEAWLSGAFEQGEAEGSLSGSPPTREPFPRTPVWRGDADPDHDAG
jgi:hypothetical protein